VSPPQCQQSESSRTPPRLRRAAGERQARPSGNSERLERVTTPSLRACQLYSEASQAGTNPRVLRPGGGWSGDPVAEANALLAFVLGRWALFAKSGFKRLPQEYWDTQRKSLFG